jgi:putative ABC transport system permease protein
MRFYRALLHLYPKSFRAEYGEDVLSVIAERRAVAPALGSRLRLALETVADTVVNASRVHGDILRQDLRYAVRTLRRAPAFAITAILLAAVGIGSTTAAVAIADHVLLRPLPYAEPHRLVRFWQQDRIARDGYNELSPGNYRDWITRSTAFESVAAYTPQSANLVGHGAPVRLDGHAATGEIFDVLGVRAVRGRAFGRQDQRDAGEAVVVLSHGAWTTYFGADAALVGRSLLLNGQRHTVVGVMPAGFMFPDRRTEFWTVLRFSPDSFDDRSNTYLRAVARLRNGRTIGQADAELEAIAVDLERQFPRENEGLGVLTVDLRGNLARSTRTLLVGIVGAAICLLLIASTNLASLLLSRGLSRLREIAVRAAIGAGRERLVRQMLTESLLLASFGGALGVVLAIASTPLLARLVPTTLPVSDVPSVDARLVGLAAAITVLTAIVFGLLPARRAASGADAAALHASARVGSSTRTEALRSALVVAQVTMSIVLLVSVGLLGRALWRVQRTDAGFRSQGVLTLRTALPWPAYGVTARREAFYQRVLDGVRALPGVERAGYITGLPMAMPGGIWGIVPHGATGNLTEPPPVSARFVTPGVFETLSIPIKDGRDISASDTRDAPLVAVVSESLVRQAWPGESGIGRRFSVMNSDRTIVGVVGDIRVRGLEQRSEPQMYLSSQQVPDNAFINYPPKELVVRASTPAAALLPSIRQIVARADPEQPISNVRMLEDIVHEHIAPRAAQVRVLVGFAGLAMLLASIGLYGLLAFAVSRRVREIGLRMALGATPKAMVGLVVRRGVVLALTGVALGIAAAYGAGRWMESLLAGVSPHDPAVYGAASAVTLTLALLGTLVPALRAARVSPLEATRAE